MSNVLDCSFSLLHSLPLADHKPVEGFWNVEKKSITVEREESINQTLTSSTWPKSCMVWHMYLSDNDPTT